MPTANTVAATRDIRELVFIEDSSLFVEDGDGALRATGTGS
jgi:hypothetical protein